ncbi:MAG: 16S rRNA (adenine(1518)-N(6)/adenine(1519)-N(6))-dimethyltransferase RsmA [Thermodesulforhabdaceae bacterium]
MFLTPREYLERFGRKASKSLGQHFLIQPKTAQRIVDALDISQNDIVVEIGPGLGALTRYLIEYPCRLHLVELDARLAEALKSLMPPSRAFVAWHIQDALDLSWERVIEDEKIRQIDKCPDRIKVVGNIPYNISSPLLFSLIASHKVIERAVLMVQREVGQRWTAVPGTKDYGIPTVILGSCAKAEKMFSVGHGQFVPPPKVESLVVRLWFFDVPKWEPLNYDFFRQFVSEVFRQRRKTIFNGLKNFISRYGIGSTDLILSCLEEMGISSSARPEELFPDVFVELAKRFAEKIEQSSFDSD